jgi:hypothetical protein
LAPLALGRRQQGGAVADAVADAVLDRQVDAALGRTAQDHAAWRDGLRPNRPQQDAGMRIEPPPSLAWAKGTTPAAVAAAAPPDEPPLECAEVPGIAGRAKATGSVVGRKPYSGVDDLPITTSPARSKASVYGSWVAGGRRWRSMATRARAGGQADIVVEVLDQERHARERTRRRALSSVEATWPCRSRDRSRR